MGFTIYYRSTRPVVPTRAEVVERAANDLCNGRTWLGCEPVGFFPGDGSGHLSGGSKPNFLPHPDDVASAAREGLPDGTTRDMIDILCQLSRDFRIDWEISHDFSAGPVGYIRGGVCDDEVMAQIDGFADLGDMLGDLEAGLGLAAGGTQPSASRDRTHGGDEGEDDGPRILPFRPRNS